MAKIDKKELAEEYGFTYAMLNAIPELKKLFEKAVKDEWTGDKFQAKVRDTKWWKTKTDTERQYLIKKYADPATAKKEYADALLKVQQFAEQLGATNSKIKKQIASAAYNLVAKGWSDAQLRNYLGQYVIFASGYSPGGEGADILDELQAYSYQMGIKNADKWYTDFTRKIVRGMSTAEDAKAAIRKQAEAQFPQYKAQLASGATVQDLAAPYLQSMSQILEIAPGTLNLMDPTIRKAMSYKDPKGKASQKPLWEFQQDLREDPRWRKTQNAQDSLSQIGHKILADFGFVS